LRQRAASVGVDWSGAATAFQWRQATLLGISKRGDVYLRTLLIHGARSAIVAAQRKTTVNPWLAGLLHRRNPNVAAVALANKNARIAWALLAHDREFQPDYVPMRAAA